MTAPAHIEATFPDAPSAEMPEFLGRVALAAAICGLAWGCTSLLFQPGTAVVPIWFGMAMRIGAYILTALAAVLIQGARGKSWHYAVVAGVSAWILLGMPFTSYEGPGSLAPEIQGRFDSAAIERASPRGGWEALVWVASIVGCASFGTWLARWMGKPVNLLAVVLCAAAGDVWLGLVHIPELVPDGHPARLLRLAWPPSTSIINMNPAITDLVFLSICIEVQRKYRLGGPPVALGALITYTAGSLITTIFWQVQLTMPLVGLGVLMGVWPDLRCKASDVMRAVVVAIVLFTLLVMLQPLHRRLHPEPKPRPIYFRMNNAT